LPFVHEVQKIVKPGSAPFSMPVLEEWMRKEVLEETLREGAFQHVEIGEREAMFGGKDAEDVVWVLKELVGSLMGEARSTQEESGSEAAIRWVLEEQRERFLREEEGMVGIKMVAWVALAQK